MHRNVAQIPSLGQGYHAHGPQTYEQRQPPLQPNAVRDRYVPGQRTPTADYSVPAEAMRTKSTYYREPSMQPPKPIRHHSFKPIDNPVGTSPYFGVSTHSQQQSSIFPATTASQIQRTPSSQLQPSTTSQVQKSTSSQFQQIPSSQARQSAAAAAESLGLLPWCTTLGRLSNEQALALSDLGGNLKEVMLVALCATVDAGARRDIENAVGREAADGVIEFFTEEYVMD